jgi:hypothetical protein
VEYPVDRRRVSRQEKGGADLTHIGADGSPALAAEAVEQALTKRVCLGRLDRGAEDLDAQRRDDGVESG